VELKIPSHRALHVEALHGRVLCRGNERNACWGSSAVVPRESGGPIFQRRGYGSPLFRSRTRVYPRSAARQVAEVGKHPTSADDTGVSGSYSIFKPCSRITLAQVCVSDLMYWGEFLRRGSPSTFEHLRRHEALLECRIGEDLLHLGIDLHHDLAAACRPWWRGRTRFRLRSPAPPASENRRRVGQLRHVLGAGRPRAP